MQVGTSNLTCKETDSEDLGSLPEQVINVSPHIQDANNSEASQCEGGHSSVLENCCHMTKEAHVMIEKADAAAAVATSENEIRFEPSESVKEHPLLELETMEGPDVSQDSAEPTNIHHNSTDNSVYGTCMYTFDPTQVLGNLRNESTDNELLGEGNTTNNSLTLLTINRTPSKSSQSGASTQPSPTTPDSPAVIHGFDVTFIDSTRNTSSHHLSARQQQEKLTALAEEAEEISAEIDEQAALAVQARYVGSYEDAVKAQYTESGTDVVHQISAAIRDATTTVDETQSQQDIPKEAYQKNNNKTRHTPPPRRWSPPPRFRKLQQQGSLAQTELIQEPEPEPKPRVSPELEDVDFTKAVKQVLESAQNEGIENARVLLFEIIELMKDRKEEKQVQDTVHVMLLMTVTNYEIFHQVVLETLDKLNDEIDIKDGIIKSLKKLQDIHIRVPAKPNSLHATCAKLMGDIFNLAVFWQDTNSTIQNFLHGLVEKWVLFNKKGLQTGIDDKQLVFLDCFEAFWEVARGTIEEHNAEFRSRLQLEVREKLLNEKVSRCVRERLLDLLLNQFSARPEFNSKLVQTDSNNNATVVETMSSSCQTDLPKSTCEKGMMTEENRPSPVASPRSPVKSWSAGRRAASPRTGPPTKLHSTPQSSQTATPASTSRQLNQSVAESSLQSVSFPAESLDSSHYMTPDESFGSGVFISPKVKMTKEEFPSLTAKPNVGPPRDMFLAQDSSNVKSPPVGPGVTSCPTSWAKIASAKQEQKTVVKEKGSQERQPAAESKSDKKTDAKNPEFRTSKEEGAHETKSRRRSPKPGKKVYNVGDYSKETIPKGSDITTSGSNVGTSSESSSKSIVDWFDYEPPESSKQERKTNSVIDAKSSYSSRPGRTPSPKSIAEVAVEWLTAPSKTEASIDHGEGDSASTAKITVKESSSVSKIYSDSNLVDSGNSNTRETMSARTEEEKSSEEVTDWWDVAEEFGESYGTGTVKQSEVQADDCYEKNNEEEEIVVEEGGGNSQGFSLEAVDVKEQEELLKLIEIYKETEKADKLEEEEAAKSRKKKIVHNQDNYGFSDDEDDGDDYRYYNLGDDDRDWETLSEEEASGSSKETGQPSMQAEKATSPLPSRSSRFKQRYDERQVDLGPVVRGSPERPRWVPGRRKCTVCGSEDHLVYACPDRAKSSHF